MRAEPALGPVAQWLEPAAHNGLVAGSSPAGPTISLLSDWWNESYHNNSGLEKVTATRGRYISDGNDAMTVPGLIRRGSAYTYRRRVPDDLREVIGKRELWVALQTTDYRGACLLARKEAVRIDGLLEAARKAKREGRTLNAGNPAFVRIGDAELQRVATLELYKTERTVAWQPGVPEGVSEEDWVDSLEMSLATYRANDANARADLFARAVRVIADLKLPIVVPQFPMTDRGLPVPGSSGVAVSPEFQHLVELLRRGQMEHMARSIDRAEGGHGENVYDRMFAGVTSFAAPPPEVRNGLSLGEAIGRFETDPTRKGLTESAGMKYRLTFRALREVVGDDRPLVEIERADCAAAQELLAGLPPNLHKLKAYAKTKTLKQAVALTAERGDKLMASGTLVVYTHTLSSFFNWALKKGLVAVNPATRLASPKMQEVSRRPFNVEELNALVAGLPAWSLPAGAKRGGRFWVPLIGLFSGMRLGEIVTLSVVDVAVKDGATCFVLRRVKGRSLKTAGSERIVPVHPELVRLGLLEHVEAMRASGGARLFQDLPGRDQDQVADLFQKRFSYWLTKVLEIKEPGLSFHSFRHGFRDALREAGVPIDSTRALGGWARSGGVEERYGQGTRPATLATWMASVRYDRLSLHALEAVSG